MKLTLLFLATTMSFLTANAQSRVEPGSEVAVGAIQATIEQPYEHPYDLPYELPYEQTEKYGRTAKCNILNHTSYESPMGAACVQCGSSYYSVTWHTPPNATFGLHPRKPVYQSGQVSSCNW